MLERIMRSARSAIVARHVRFGLLADIALLNCDVCFTPESRHHRAVLFDHLIGAPD